MQDLLLLDPSNPRSLTFQFALLERHAGNLPAGPNPDGVTEFRRRVAQLMKDLDRLRASGFEPARGADTATWLAKVASELSTLSDLLTHVYFSQVLPRVS